MLLRFQSTSYSLCDTLGDDADCLYLIRLEVVNFQRVGAVVKHNLANLFLVGETLRFIHDTVRQRDCARGAAGAEQRQQHPFTTGHAQ